MCSVVDKIDLLSEATAANMVALHMLAHPHLGRACRDGRV